jgi:hypothetical protein
LYGEVEVVGRGQLREEESILDGVEADALDHLHGQDVILTASSVTHRAKQLTVQLLKISAKINNYNIIGRGSLKVINDLDVFTDQ